MMNTTRRKAATLGAGIALMLTGAAGAYTLTGVAGAQDSPSTTLEATETTVSTEAPSTATEDSLTTTPSTESDTSTTDSTESDTSKPDSTDSDASKPEGDRGQHRRGDKTEELLTGEQAEKAKAAALKAVPGGTVDRVETDAEGASFEAHVTDADGNRKTVKLDENFTVIGVEEGC